MMVAKSFRLRALSYRAVLISLVIIRLLRMHKLLSLGGENLLILTLRVEATALSKTQLTNRLSLF